MYKKTFCALSVFTLVFVHCRSQKKTAAYSSADLKIIPLTEHSFVHISYLNVPEYGRVACNGAIYIDSGEAVVFDTPVDDAVSLELIQWITETKKHQVTAVVINHFHNDCVGGLAAFHKLNIPSYANQQTLVLAKQEGHTVPKVGFEGSMELTIGNNTVVNRFFGEAHTLDNIISYIPSEALVFGGCAVKSMSAGKGNLEDANIAEWSATMEKIKKTYPNVQTVIPGHGDSGGIELLEYTRDMFKKK